MQLACTIVHRMQYAADLTCIEPERHLNVLIAQITVDRLRCTDATSLVLCVTKVLSQQCCIRVRIVLRKEERERRKRCERVAAKIQTIEAMCT